MSHLDCFSSYNSLLMRKRGDGKMRDASHLESNSVNSYVNNISVDTGTSFYDQRGYRKINQITEPKIGHWILKSHMWECDKCGCRIRRANPFKGNIWNYNYCPNCGDKKEEVTKEQEEVTG